MELDESLPSHSTLVKDPITGKSISFRSGYNEKSGNSLVNKNVRDKRHILKNLKLNFAYFDNIS